MNKGVFSRLGEKFVSSTRLASEKQPRSKRTFDIGEHNVNDLGEVRVNRLSRCTCGNEAYDDFHVKVNTYSTRLEEGNAVAISYGIGDFGRAHHLVGHIESSDQPVRLEFGAEWDLEALKKTLIAICGDRKAIWFDQLSITQDPELIPLELKRIPLIYSTFDTIVVLPDAPCPCLGEAVRRFENGDQTVTIPGPAYIKDSKDLSGRFVTEACVNAVPQASYYARLWTMQEFTYARCISVRFCTKPPSTCPTIPQWFKSEEGVQQAIPLMNKLARYEYNNIVANTKDLGSQAGYAAASLLSVSQQETSSRLELLVARFQHRGGVRSGSTFYTGARLLLGDVLKRERTRNEADFISQAIWAVGMRTRHRASVIEDYVLATFPIYEGYRVPAVIRNVGLGYLLEDAIRQWEGYNKRIQLTTVPHGLFELGKDTIRCKPTLYFSPSDTTCLSDVYCVFQISSAKPSTTQGHLPIEFRADQRSRMTNALTYEKALGRVSTNDALEFVRAAAGKPAGRPRRSWGREIETVRAWTRLDGYAMNGSTYGPHTLRGFSGFQEAVDTFRALTEKAPKSGWRWDHLPEIDHHAAAYDIVARWIGLDPTVAREKGLGLTVTLDDPPCIGLVNGAVYAQLRAREQDEVSKKSDLLGCQWLSINMCTRLLSDSSIVYDAYHQGEFMDPKLVKGLSRHAKVPIYRVAAVWLDTPFEHPSIGADLSYDWKSWDAVLL